MNAMNGCSQYLYAKKKTANAAFLDTASKVNLFMLHRYGI